MIPLLMPLFQGEMAPYGESLLCAQQFPPEAISVTTLTSEEVFAPLIRCYASHLGIDGNDLRAAASAWSLAYIWTLLPPVVAACSVLQHVFPVQADAIAVSLSDTGTPARFHILCGGKSMAGQPTPVRYSALLEQHLAPLFRTVRQCTKLPLKILWGNTARHMETIFNAALLLTQDAGHVIADQNELLRESVWSDGRRNPMYGNRGEIVRMQMGQPVIVRLHRQCCLYYRLPDSDYCGACPLASAHEPRVRSDIARARHPDSLTLIRS